jgi:hypothetical protein
LPEPSPVSDYASARTQPLLVAVRSKLATHGEAGAAVLGIANAAALAAERYSPRAERLTIRAWS